MFVPNFMLFPKIAQWFHHIAVLFIVITIVCLFVCFVFAVLSPYAYTIGDLTSDEFQPHETGGIATQVKMPTTVKFVRIPFSEYFSNFEACICAYFSKNAHMIC